MMPLIVLVTAGGTFVHSFDAPPTLPPACVSWGFRLFYRAGVLPRANMVYTEIPWDALPRA